MVKKITNVTYVENHFLEQGTSRHTLIEFTMEKKIRNITKLFIYIIFEIQAGVLKTEVSFFQMYDLCFSIDLSKQYDYLIKKFDK